MNLKKSFRHICEGSALFFIIFLLLSCKNFFGTDSFISDLKNAIDYDNIPFTSVIIKSDLAYTNSLIPGEGIYDSMYRPGDLLSLSFEEKSNYNFLNWVVDPPEGAEFVNCRKGNHDVTLKIGNVESVTISLLCVEKGKLKINFTAEHAKVTPVDEKSYYIGDEFNINCYEEDDYCFLEWQVFDSEGNYLEDYSDYIDIGKPNAQLTNVVVYKTGNVLTIKPKLVKRPKVSSATPIYESKGVYRERNIVVKFDEDMDKSSIYYSDDEITNLNAAGYTLLKDENRGGRCYGYINTEGEIIYKNIQIQHYTNEYENYLQYYDVPYFKPASKDTLVITTNKQNPPPAEVDLLVTLKKDFCYRDMENDSLIPLRSDFSFVYRTNTSNDNVNPGFGRYDDSEYDFVVKNVPENETNITAYNKSWDSLSFFSEDNTTKSNLHLYHVRSCKFWIRGSLYDGGSGLSRVDWTLSKIESIPYYSNTPVFYTDTLLLFPHDGTTDATIDTLLDLSSLNLQSGVYVLKLFLSDVCDNTEEYKTLCFLYDAELPDFKSIQCDSDITDNKYRLVLKIDTEDDLELIKVSSEKNSYYYYMDMNDVYIRDENNEQILDLGLQQPPGNPQYLKLKKDLRIKVDLAGLITFENECAGTINIQLTDISGNEKNIQIEGTYYDRYVNKGTGECGFLGFILNDSQGSTVISEHTDSNGNLLINGTAIPKTSEIIALPVEADSPKYEGQEFQYPFAMGQYPVTWDLYNAVMGTNNVPAQNEVAGTPGENPVTGISWNDAILFCNKLSEIMGLNPYYDTGGNRNYNEGYHLPTWQEWKFCRRGGNPRNDDAWEYSYSGSNDLSEIAWYSGNSDGKTHAVGSKKPNALNIYDMTGNVSEWVEPIGDIYEAWGGTFNSQIIDDEILELNTNGKNLSPEYSDNTTGIRVIRNLYSY